MLTTRQAEDVGVPAVEVRKLAARGALERVGYGTYRHKAVSADDWTALAGALGVVGENTYLEGDTVLALFDLALVNPSKARVGASHRYRGRPPADVVVSRRRVPDADLATYHGLRATTVRRALLDSVDHLLPGRVRDAVADGERRDLLTGAESAEILNAVAERERNLVKPDHPAAGDR
ncbi:hypothetical protein BKD30_00950 [Tersicoccus phoenicis]|uniref:AbiEi antitoxin N-terminal domain-containing protein n=1 Tax=Tersicoccus phoenicis TaxID=554083 RepID=A0A1R1LP26_9MICC|nr:type IV toxin-antitoxin system AbiEi family antitoxin domain-containing protein [Tersicoccus phoenicis]OMH29290.1 hypothetical protein BKD30_00950 [Tersicoccus phoenicis]